MKGNKYFFKNCFEKFQNHFSNFETPSLAVSKFRKKLLKNSKTPRKKNRFQIQQNYFFRFQSSKRFLLVFQPFSSSFQYENNFFFIFTKFLIVFKCFKRFFPFSSQFQYENEKIIIFTKILFSKSYRFQMFQNNFFRFSAVL